MLLPHRPSVRDTRHAEQTENYDYYTLLKATSNGSTALYAGSPSDYKANEADPTIYNITVSPSDLGTILNKPATPKNYNGIEAGHYYIGEGGSESVIDINTNTSSGLINTNYLGNYPSEISTALNFSEDKPIQPLMIRPTSAGKSYGFIGESYTINKDTEAKITLKVKVVDANAYIYLIDTSTTQKNILKFDAFDVNTNVGYNTNLTNIHVEEQELFFNLSKTDGWVDIEFNIATGNTAKEFRLEFWNGSRSDTTSTNNKGFVFVNDVNVVTNGGFDEPTSWENAFALSGTPLADNYTQLIDESGKLKNYGSLIAHQRELTDREIEYNNDKDKTLENIKYNPKYIWAKTDTMIYAIYDTIDPILSDPYDNEPTDTVTEEESLLDTDPATFWLSFSSILLGVVLLLAIIMLFIKNIRRRRKANASDAKSHYTVKSRVSKPKADKKQKVQKEEIVDEDSTEETLESEEVDTDVVETNDDAQEEVEESQEQTLDDYVYGDVQDFGEQDNQETNLDEQTKDE